MDKMCELAKTISDLKLTKCEIRKGLSGFEVLTISKRCKLTVNETCELIERLLENNTNIKFLKKRGYKMKYTLYKDDKFIMQRKHFYPIKMYLIKSL